MYVKVTDYNLRNDAIRLQISISMKVIAHICMPDLTVREIMFQMFDHVNLGQSHKVEHYSDITIWRIQSRYKSYAFLHELSPSQRY